MGLLQKLKSFFVFSGAGDFDYSDTLLDASVLDEFDGPRFLGSVGGRFSWSKIIDRDKNLAAKTTYVNGYLDRGAPVMEAKPAAILWHWTAGKPTPTRPAPSLNICIKGRPDVPGPLCHIFIDLNGKVYVIASGRANHAGRGHVALLDRMRKGLPPLGKASKLKLADTGGSGGALIGVEIENDGKEPFTPAQVDSVVRFAKVVQATFGLTEAQVIRWDHASWTKRKIDIDDKKMATLLAAFRQLK